MVDSTGNLKAQLRHCQADSAWSVSVRDTTVMHIGF